MTIKATIYAGTKSVSFSSFEITHRIHAANTMSFVSDVDIADSTIIHYEGDTHPFGGKVVGKTEDLNGYKYDVMDWTRNLHSKINQSFKKNKKSSQIMRSVLKNYPTRLGGIKKTTKKHPALVFKNQKVIDVMYQLANLETNMRFSVTQDNICKFQKIPAQEKGYVFTSATVEDYSMDTNSKDIITGVKVYGKDNKLLYNYNNKTLKGKYGTIIDIIEDSGLTTKSQAKAAGQKLFKEKKRPQFSGRITIDPLKDMKSDMWCAFAPPSWSKAKSKTYYISEVKTILDDNDFKQKITFLDGKPQPPNEWIYTPPDESSSSSTSAEAKGAELKDPRTIRKWIDANISYEKYKNHRHMPDAVLKRKKANCMDQARLFIAMVKPLGYEAKMSGNVYCNDIRHNNALIKMNGRWITVDTTCHKLNRL